MRSPDYNYDYAVIGGDRRQTYLTEMFARESGRVCYFALCEKPKEGDLADSLLRLCGAAPCVVGPVPFSKNGDILNQSADAQALPIDQILSHMNAGQTFVAGCIPEDFRLKAVQKGVRVFDLMKDPQLSVFNTLATAEGAICEAIKRSPFNLRHSFCAVLGYGKCGNTITSYLKGMHCHVYAAANPLGECAQAALVADEAGSLEEFASLAGKFDYVFNTIPAPVMGREILEKIKPSAVIVDIASAPGGVDYEAAEKLGLCAVLCPGLPGKYAPASSAEAMKKVIERFLKE